MSTVIKVEGLGKSYTISHEERERYTALRDVVVGKTKRIFAFNKQENIHHTKEEFWALKDINFEVNQGDRIGIIGSNGAGKSTLLKILSRITEPTEGSVKIKGRIASLLEVGTGFHPELSGRENIFLNGAILGMNRAEVKKKFDEIVDFAEIEKFLDTPVKRYSSGMYVRLAFAVAAHLEPEILVVDEVLAVGDIQFQKKCLGKMQDVSNNEGRTVLFVSHNMAAIKRLCNNAIWLMKGKVAGNGDVTEQITEYIKSDNKRVKITSDSSFMIGSKLELRRFDFKPNPIESGKEQEFYMEFWAPSCLSFDAITILIYTSYGIRIAVMDLRRLDSNYQLDGETPLIIKGKILALPLVEGDYRVGLYIKSGEINDNFSDLFDLTVTGKKMRNGVIPYPSSVRGVVELEFDILT